MAETLSSPLTFATLRRLQYAQGYLTLGLTAEAAVELEGISPPDRETPEVMDAGMHLLYIGEKWQPLFDLSGACTARFPQRLEGWINLAFAARRLKGVAWAKALLLKVEPTFGSTHALVPYNLACYHCLLGEMTDARRRLSVAFQLDPSLRKIAADDEDLKALRAELGVSEGG
jgi:hypothetical protein